MLSEVELSDLESSVKVLLDSESVDLESAVTVSAPVSMVSEEKVKVLLDSESVDLESAVTVLVD